MRIPNICEVGIIQKMEVKKAVKFKFFGHGIYVAITPQN